MDISREEGIRQPEPEGKIVKQKEGLIFIATSQEEEENDIFQPGYIPKIRKSNLINSQNSDHIGDPDSLRLQIIYQVNFFFFDSIEHFFGS